MRSAGCAGRNFDGREGSDKADGKGVFQAFLMGVGLPKQGRFSGSKQGPKTFEVMPL